MLSPTAGSRSKGTDRGVGLFELGGQARRDRRRRPMSKAGSAPIPMAGMSVRSRSIAETGVVRIVRYTTIDDVGRAVNPLILHGQTHGGIAQGAGQALDGALLLRPARPASVGFVYGLRHAARRRLPVLRHGAERGAVDQPPARLSRRRRGRHHAGARASSSTRSSMRSPSLASRTSTCRQRPNACGRRSAGRHGCLDALAVFRISAFGRLCCKRNFRYEARNIDSSATYGWQRRF